MSEFAIRDEIFEYLMRVGIFAVRDRQPPKLFRHGFKPEQRGIPDIWGVLKGGRFFGIEVKTEKGKLSFEQGEFINNVRAQGGIAFVARSVEDVIARFKETENASSGTRLH